jgi:Tfp pilus assembly protein PilV
MPSRLSISDNEHAIHAVRIFENIVCHCVFSCVSQSVYRAVILHHNALSGSDVHSQAHENKTNKNNPFCLTRFFAKIERTKRIASVRGCAAKAAPVTASRVGNELSAPATKRKHGNASTATRGEFSQWISKAIAEDSQLGNAGWG